MLRILALAVAFLFVATPVLAQTGGATTSSGTAATGAEKDQDKEKDKAKTDDMTKKKGTAADQKDKTTGGSASPGTSGSSTSTGSGAAPGATGGGTSSGSGTK